MFYNDLDSNYEESSAKTGAEDNEVLMEIMKRALEAYNERKKIN